MSDTQTVEQPKTLAVWARVKTAEVNVETGEVTLQEDVSPKFAVQALLQEIQMLQNQVKELQEKMPKEEETKDL